jgi:stringent starvation protein B
MSEVAELPSQRPYLVRALYEWCIDSGFTPYLTVVVGAGVRVPMEFVRDGRITLNVGPDATQGLRLGNDWIEFKARFGGVAREILVPIERVEAIFARENQQGLGFQVVDAPAAADTPALAVAEAPPQGSESDNPPPSDPAPRPTLTRVK